MRCHAAFKAGARSEPHQQFFICLIAPRIAFWCSFTMTVARRIESMVVVVTGASRGIGLQLVKDLLARPNTVIAAARKPDASSELAQLQKGLPVGGAGAQANDHAQDLAPAAPEGQLQLIALDVSSAKSIQQFVQQLKQSFSHIDVSGRAGRRGMRPFASKAAGVKHGCG
jgi:NADP-dependent 3-hydroxy acid dehydrogenase YdfG